jgi:hypothetical protein
LASIGDVVFKSLKIIILPHIALENILYGFVKVRTTARQVSPNCQVFPTRHALYAKVNKVQNVVEI